MAEDLVTLYRGVDKFVNTFTPKSFEGNILEGRWWGTDPSASRKYSQGLLKGSPKLGGVMYEMDVPKSSLPRSETFRNKLINRGYDFLDNPKWNPNAYLATKKLIKEGAPKINWGQTALSNLEALKSQGLGFVKRNALKTLGKLGTLHAQAGIATLTPTMMGNAELPQMPQGSPAQINQGGGHVQTPGTYDTDISTGGSGDHRTMANGGRIGYFFGGRISFKNGGLASIL